MSARSTPRRLLLLGHPVAHSLSPVFQNAALEAAGVDVRYEALDVPPAQLAVTLGRVRADGLAGNVTAPHKVAVHDACDRRTADAERVGAVNTFWTESGRLVGDNTDVEGLEAALAALGVGALGGTTIWLIGGGGAAAAVVEVARRVGAVVTIAGRTAARAEVLRRRAPETVGAVVSPESLDGRTPAAPVALVVNATPVGSDGASMPLPAERVPPGAAVLDLVYRSGGTTPWVAACRARGHRADDGRTMLLAQGAAAFTRWFGVAPDLARMRAAVAAVSGG